MHPHLKNVHIRLLPHLYEFVNIKFKFYNVGAGFNPRPVFDLPSEAP